MGSVVLSDASGLHFHNAVWGAAGPTHCHPPPQDTPALHHMAAPLRPSPHASAHPPPPRASAGSDVVMAEHVPTPSVSAPHGPRMQLQLQLQGSSHASEHRPRDSGAAAQLQHPPSTPQFRPHSQQKNPLPTTSNVNASANSRPMHSSASSSVQHSPISSLRSPLDSTAPSPRRIKVKSLSHIQSFATDESSPFSQARSVSRRQRRDTKDLGPQYEISEMPVTDIIEMVAGLLTKITTTNDRQHDHAHHPISSPDASTALSQHTSSVLAFHGKNVPNISILSYLSRIHKYCPTTYEVFLSLLVYFDRMTERVNSAPAQTARSGSDHRSSSLSAPSSEPSPPAPPNQMQAATPPPSGSLGRPSDDESPPLYHVAVPDSDQLDLPHFFVVDSYNIHRLVIAGVTCASKFFSDVFYTNSRYAKVRGGHVACIRC